MHGQYKSVFLSSHLLYWLAIFQYNKKYFVYKKVTYWASNHTQQKCNNLKKLFGDFYSKYKV